MESPRSTFPTPSRAGGGEGGGEVSIGGVGGVGGPLWAATVRSPASPIPTLITSWCTLRVLQRALWVEIRGTWRKKNASAGCEAPFVHRTAARGKCA